MSEGNLLPVANLGYSSLGSGDGGLWSLAEDYSEKQERPWNMREELEGNYM
jgi:hypothetical protein